MLDLLAHFTDQLDALPPTRRYWIAFSGGLDSSVLLHLLSRLPHLPAERAALHIHHGIHPDADEWAVESQRRACALGIDCQIRRVSLPQQSGESLEALAREARYRALGELLAPGEIVLTAQHADDQAETLLLQLLRGSGPQGLAAMPLLTPLARGWLARPLLACSQAELLAYAEAEGVRWIEDSSNRDLRFDRNFLRHQVIPLLRQRYPGLPHTLSRSARHCAEATSLLKQLAQQDLEACRAGERLRIEALEQLPVARQRNLLRHWIASRNLPLPGHRGLQRILDEVLCAHPHRDPLVRWAGGEVRRFRQWLYAFPPLPSAVPYRLPWNGEERLALPHGMGHLSLRRAPGGIDPRQWQAARIEVRSRRGGERCRPPGDLHHRPLKQLYQEWAVPPWERPLIPLLYLNDQLAAIAGYWVCSEFSTVDQEPGLIPCWKRLLDEAPE